MLLPSVCYSECSRNGAVCVNGPDYVFVCLFQVWCDWLLCHSAVWNPPPSCVDYRVG